MRPLAVLLALCQALPAAALAPEASTGSYTLPGSTLTITAPREPASAQALRAARAGGGAVAVGGLGAMGYMALFSAGGPFGWAAALVLMGGMTAYLAHRRLSGKQDFPPAEAPPPAPPQRRRAV